MVSPNPGISAIQPSRNFSLPLSGVTESPVVGRVGFMQPTQPASSAIHQISPFTFLDASGASISVPHMTTMMLRSQIPGHSIGSAPNFAPNRTPLLSSAVSQQQQMQQHQQHQQQQQLQHQQQQLQHQQQQQLQQQQIQQIQQHHHRQQQQQTLQHHQQQQHLQQQQHQQQQQQQQPQLQQIQTQHLMQQPQLQHARQMVQQLRGCTTSMMQTQIPNHSHNQFVGHGQFGGRDVSSSSAGGGANFSVSAVLGEEQRASRSIKLIPGPSLNGPFSGRSSENTQNLDSTGGIHRTFLQDHQASSHSNSSSDFMWTPGAMRSTEFSNTNSHYGPPLDNRLGQFSLQRPNSYSMHPLSKSRALQLSGIQGGGGYPCVVTSKARHNVIGRSFPGGPRQFTSSRGSTGEAENTDTTSANNPNSNFSRHFLASRDFPNVHRSARSTPSVASSFALIDRLMSVTLNDKMVSSMMENSAARFPQKPMIPLSTCIPSFSDRTTRMPSSPNYQGKVSNKEGMGSPGNSSKSPITASSIEDSPQAIDDRLIFDTGGLPRDFEEKVPRDSDLASTTVPSIVSDQQLITCGNTDVESVKYDENLTQMADDSSNPQSLEESAFLKLKDQIRDVPTCNTEFTYDTSVKAEGVLPVMAAVLIFLDGAGLSKCESVNCALRKLIREKAICLWKFAMLSDEEDFRGIWSQPTPTQSMLDETSPISSSFYKLKWLCRQGALHYIGYVHRLREYDEKKPPEQKAATESFPTPDEGNYIDNNTRQHLMPQARKTSQIYSDIKYHSRGVLRVLRAIRAIQNSFRTDSPEFHFTSELLRLPWAKASVFSYKERDGSQRSAR